MYAEYILARASLENWRKAEKVEEELLCVHVYVTEAWFKINLMEDFSV